jgi:hypothetical protein
VGRPEANPLGAFAYLLAETGFAIVSLKPHEEGPDFVGIAMLLVLRRIPRASPNLRKALSNDRAQTQPQQLQKLYALVPYNGTS